MVLYNKFEVGQGLPKNEYIRTDFTCSHTSRKKQSTNN